MLRTQLVRVLTLGVLLVGGAALALGGEDPPPPAAKPDVDLAAAAKVAGTVNGLCPIMLRPVTPEGGSVGYQGERIGFCCPGCTETFGAETAYYMDRMRLDPTKFAYTSKKPTREALAKAAAEAKSANGRCPVMGGLVSPRGGSSTYGQQTIAFCCPGCRAKFDADPERYMKALRDDPSAYGYARPGPTPAELHDARVAAHSVNGLCPIQRRLVTPRGGSAEADGQRVAFCCPGCKAKFEADPTSFLERMHAEPAVYGFVPAR